MKKQFFYAMTFLCSLALCGALASCSDDDDDDNGGNGGGSGSGVKKCYFEAENQRTDFKYAYYYVSEEDGEIELNFTTIDMLYYYNNPDKIKKGIYFSSVDLRIGCYDDDYSIPTGEIPYGGDYETDGDNDYHFEMDTKIELYEVAVNNGDDALSLWYVADWNRDYKSGAAVITKLSGNSYKIEIPSLKLLRGYDDGSDSDGIDENNPKATGKFYFEGSFVTVDDLVDETRSIREVKDPGFWKWLKAMRKSSRGK